MKLKTWHLFLCVSILFGCSFYVVNLKFDKFSRVNGINNDNRVLIEKYLDETEQTYLIDNQIPIQSIISYLQEEDFYIENYQFYSALEKTQRYKKQDILETGNGLSTRLNYLYKDNALRYAQLLIDREMELAFLSESNFSFDYIEYYTYLKALYVNYDYVDDGNTYVEKLHDMGIDKKDDLLEIFQTLTHAYSKQSLKQLLLDEVPDNVSLVLNPCDASTLVDKQHYIASYEPKDLLLVQDVPRIRYAMYLQKDAYNALLKMYAELNQHYSGFLLREAHLSLQTLDEKEIGYNECQLGTTIQVSQSLIHYQDFARTDMSQWLETHAHEYGFILRYPKNKASITNHAYDAHTYRYVGIELAKELYESQMTLEEYHAHQE